MTDEADVRREAEEMVRLFRKKAAMTARLRAIRAIQWKGTGQDQFWNKVADAIMELERRNQVPETH